MNYKNDDDKMRIKYYRGLRCCSCLHLAIIFGNNRDTYYTTCAGFVETLTHNLPKYMN